eukprot:TRINITY_DN4101_c0_g3_i1.p1 TRINITY_DN4101_c0_g3~~TRINITY_DN4101_c0_g3_i1.p1  ORF type:complete len:273 (+),score=129.02 TRINITY_DN4101_c0_g3_i1:141-959(+)
MSKPTLPESYVLPEVWQPPAEVRGTNRATAGVREEEELPKGSHDLQLYSLATPNGQKVTILLEELGVEYDAFRVPISGKQFTSGFVELNPNSKIPAMHDHGEVDAQGGPLRLFESGSILLYLAEKFQRFIPQDTRGRAEVVNWLMWQMGGAPFIGGGYAHFVKFAPVHIEYAVDRYSMETKRQLDVLDKHLEGKEYVAGDYSIADIAIFPWVRALHANSNTFLQVDGYKNVAAWRERIAARPAVKRGLRVNSSGDDGVAERHSKADFSPEDY